MDRRYLITLLLIFCMPAFVYAHQFSYGAVKTTLTVQGKTIDLQTKAPLGLTIYPLYEDKQLKLFEGLFQSEFEVATGGLKCDFNLFSLKSGEGSEDIFTGRYVCPNLVSGQTIHIKSTLFSEYFQNYDQFIELDSGGRTQQIILTPQKPVYPEGGPEDGVFFVLNQFIYLGIAHILTGYDHILFLLSVTLLIRSMRRILLLVTSFTVAHSLTLLLSGFHILSIPARIVEPLIALSIVYVAFRNLWSLWRGEPDEHLGERWFTVFAFGLVHGLGFANAIADAAIPSQYFVLALIVFNIGIEIGQLGILFAAVPLLKRLEHKTYKKPSLMYASAIVCFIAATWFVERLL